MQLDDVLSEVARRFSQEMAALEELFESFTKDLGPDSGQAPAADLAAALNPCAAEPQPA